MVTQNFSRRLWQLQQIKRRQTEGISIKATAQLLGMSRNTVKKYLDLQEPPRRRFSVQVNIALFDAYIRGRIEEEPSIQLMQLYKEIKQRGYNGGRTSAFVHLHEYINRAPRFIPPRLPDIFYLRAKVPFLLLKERQQLTPPERKLVTGLCQKCPQIKTAYGLAREFKDLLEQKKGNLLQQWVNKVVTSGIGELKGFAGGLLSDLEAVKNAFDLPWSNGQVED